MTRYLPEVDIVDVRRHHLSEASPRVLQLHQLQQLVVDLGPVRSEEGTAWSVFRIPKEEVLLLPYQPVVTLLSLFLRFQVLLELLLLLTRVISFFSVYVSLA